MGDEVRHLLPSPLDLGESDVPRVCIFSLIMVINIYILKKENLLSRHYSLNNRRYFSTNSNISKNSAGIPL